LGDRVLALGTLCAVGKGSGVEADVPYTVLARFSDGLMIQEGTCCARRRPRILKGSSGLFNEIRTHVRNPNKSHSMRWMIR